MGDTTNYRLGDDVEYKKLSDVFEIGKSYSFSRSYEVEESNCQHIHYGDIHTKSISIVDNNSSLPYISEDCVIDNKDYVSTGDVILADASEDYKDLGKSVYIDDIREQKVISGLHTFHLKPLIPNLGLYFKYYTESEGYKKYMSQRGTGISVFGISKSNLENLPIPIPKNQEVMVRSSNLMSKLDSQISNYTKQKELLEQKKKHYLNVIFNDKNGGNYRLVEDVEYVKLGEVARFKKGRGISKNDVVANGSIKCIRYGELFTDYSAIIKEVNNYTNQKDNVLSLGNETLVPTSDVTPYGLATASAILVPKVSLGGDIIVISSDKLDNRYLSYALRSSKRQILSLVTGTTVFHLYEKDLRQVVIPFYSLEQQQKYVDLLSNIDELINLYQKQKLDLEQKKKHYLNVIFNDKIE